MVRTMVESLVADKNVAGKKTLRKDIEQDHLNTMSSFHRRSFYWPYMLNFNCYSRKYFLRSPFLS